MPRPRPGVAQRPGQENGPRTGSAQTRRRWLPSTGPQKEPPRPSLRSSQDNKETGKYRAATAQSREAALPGGLSGALGGAGSPSPGPPLPRTQLPGGQQHTCARGASQQRPLPAAGLAGLSSAPVSSPFLPLGCLQR